MRRRHLVPLVVLIVAATACGSDHSAHGNAGSAAGGATSSGALLNDADTEFAKGMIEHHRQAIEMAELALDPARGAGADVIDLATRIEAAQDPEVQLMQGWLDASGMPADMDHSHEHDMSAMPGMMSDDDMAALATMNGAAFDQMWLEMMIAHHQGAIAQSESVKKAGSNTDVLALADRIITAQQAEIAEMKALLG